MADYIDHLLQKLGNNTLSELYCERFSNEVDPAALASFNELVNKSLNHYRPFLANSGLSDNEPIPAAFLDRLIELFPTLLYRLTSTFHEEAGDLSSLQSLRLAVAAYLLSIDKNEKVNASIILGDIDDGQPLNVLNSQLFKKDKSGFYGPKAVYLDMLSIAKSATTLPGDSHRQTVTENFFCLESISQHFILFLLSMLSRSKSDVVTAHIHLMFQPVYSPLKLWETELHKQNQAIQDVVNRMFSNEDSERKTPEETRLTSYYREKVFIHNASFLDYHPRSSPVSDARFTDMLARIFQLSLMGLVVFLQAVLNIAGRTTVEIILDRCRDSVPGKFNVFQKFINTQTQGPYKALAELTRDRVDDLDSRLDEGGEEVSISKSERAETGLSQSQIQDYLADQLDDLFKSGMDNPNENSQDLIVETISHISASTAKTLSGIVTDYDDVKILLKLQEPLISSLGNRKLLTESDLRTLRTEFEKQSVQHRENLIEIKGLLAEIQSDPEIDKSPESNRLLSEEIVPIGLEKGAPRISLNDFFKFPLKSEKSAPSRDHYEDHLRYLHLASEKSLFKAEALKDIEKIVTQLPTINYRKWYDIFPFDSFDETKLLAVFSLWRNQVLDRLVIPSQVEE